MKKHFFYLISIVLIFSCKEESEEGWVVRYRDDVITNTELKQVMPKNLPEDDSLKFVNAYVKNWVMNRVLITEKDELLTEEEINKLELKVAKYREDLTEIMIEDKLIIGFSDSVSEQDLMQYYKDFPETFVLKNDILSYRIMEIPTDSLRRYRDMMRDNKIAELEKLLKTNNYYHDFKANNWIEKDKLIETDILPEKLKKLNLLVENQIFTENKNDNTFVFQTIEIGKSGSPAPYNYIKPTIKNVLLNKRKLNLLSQKKNELYEKVLENDEIERK